MHADSGDIPPNAKRTINILLFTTVAIAHAWFRGPLFGLLPFYIFTLPFAAALAFLLNKLKFDQRIKAALAVAGSIGISYWLCAPPNTSRLFLECFGMNIPPEVRNLQRWNDNWARDPAYFLRFEADAATIDRLVSSGKFYDRSEDVGLHIRTPFSVSSDAPAWWNLAELSSPRMWNQHRTLWVNLFYDPSVGVAYVQALTR